jgi:uncharacterized membrane protein
MLSTILLLVLCALIAIAAIPLILKLVPPNEIYGVRTERALSRKEVWYEVNWFGGWALVAAAVSAMLTLVLMSNTSLRSFWPQLIAFVLPLGIAVGATLWYDRRIAQHGKLRRRT